MTKKDLFDGLNYIDDKIIEEAQQKRLPQWRQSLLLQS